MIAVILFSEVECSSQYWEWASALRWMWVSQGAYQVVGGVRGPDVTGR
jgi:hypothetical protein